MRDIILGFLLAAWMITAWITHLAICFADDRWGFLIAGALCFPVAIIHGTGVWFGAW